ncbi:MAG: hypothetical protein QXN35_00995 [Ignisphaera sp.]
MILHMIDVDGKTLTLKVLSENIYPTHIDMHVECIHSFPDIDIVDRKFRLLLIPNYNRYMISRFRVKKIIRGTDIVILSGYIDFMKGVAVFKPGLPYNVFIDKISSSSSEPYFKTLYEGLKQQLSNIESIKGYTECINIVSELHKKYAYVINRYIDIFKDSIQISSPDTALLLESILAMGEIPRTAQQEIQKPAKKGLLQRIKDMIKSLVRRK